MSQIQYLLRTPFELWPKPWIAVALVILPLVVGLTVAMIGVTGLSVINAVFPHFEAQAQQWHEEADRAARAQREASRHNVD